MRIYKLHFFYIATFLFSSIASLNAQVTEDRNKNKENKDTIDILSIDKEIRNLNAVNLDLSIDPLLFTDSVTNKFTTMPRDSNGLIILPRNNWTPFDNYTTFLDTILIEPAFLPIVFDGRLLPDDLNFMQSNKPVDYGIKQYHLIAPESTFANKLDHIRNISRMRKYYYTNNMKNVKLNALTFTGSPVIEQDILDKKNPFQRLISTEKPINISTPELERIAIRQKFWLIHGEHNLQFSINEFTDNWSGGDDNYTLKNYHKFTLNYKKNKLAFTNTLEWRLNLIRTEGDSTVLHPTRVIDDYLRTYSTVGIDAYKNWSYSSNLEVKTPLFNRFNAKDDKKGRAIFSPLEINAGIGMRYNMERKSKVNKYRSFKISTDLSVLSIDYKFVGDGLVNRSQFGIEDGKRSIINYGSTFNINTSYNLNQSTGFTSRLKYFTSYDKVQVEFENTLNYKLNNYFSTQVYFYMKYNDGVSVENKDPKWGYFMFNTMLSFGLSYNW